MQESNSKSGSQPNALASSTEKLAVSRIQSDFARLARGEGYDEYDLLRLIYYVSKRTGDDGALVSTLRFGIEHGTIIEKINAARQRLEGVKTRRFYSNSLRKWGREIATDLWETDINQNYNTLTGMAKKVACELEAIFDDDYPDFTRDEHDMRENLKKGIPKPETIRKNWLSDIAPGYAKKPGAPRKT